MGIETRGIPSVNSGEGFVLARTILDNKASLTILNTGDSGKDAILEEIAAQLNNHPESQGAFIIELFDELAREGGGVQTNRRDGAFEILTSQVMEPIIRGNSTIVSYAYLEAISLQGQQNDPFSGSIDTLLEVGKAITPYFPIDSGLKKKIIKAWNGVINEFLWQDEKSYMRSKLKEIKYIMSPTRIFDDQVKKLIEEGLSSREIAERFSISIFKVRNSRARLLAAGEIEPRKRGKPQTIIERDKQVKKLIEEGLKNPEIAKELDLSLSEVKNSCARLLAAGKIELRKSGRPKTVIKQEGESSSQD